MNVPEEAMNQVDQPALQRRSYRNPPQGAPAGLQFNVQDPESGMGYGNGNGMMSNQTMTDEEDEEPPYTPVYPNDAPIFPGGPYESQILSWKKQYGEVYLADINEDVYIFRNLNRFEYKQIVAMPDTDPLIREEMICEVCTLWPQGLTWQEMAGGKAGSPARLSEQILDKSNFTRNVSVRPL